MMAENYYVGLDIGTSSVGWAVTDTDYNILRRKGKDLWGARMFDEAKPAAERRTQRIARRRIAREHARIEELNRIFALYIAKEDPDFFLKLQESKFFIEDRSDSNKQPYTIFNDRNYTDIDYHKEYKTIFHLRQELLHPSEEHAKSPVRYSARLLYIALLNMYKHRGHFLNENLDENGSGSFEDSWKEMVRAYRNLFMDGTDGNICDENTVDISELKDAFNRKDQSRTDIAYNVLSMLGYTKKDKREAAILRLSMNLEANLSDIFGSSLFEDDEAAKLKKLNMGKSDLDEKLVALEPVLDEDQYAFLLTIKSFHDSIVLDHIMHGRQFISDARVDEYNEHHEDLCLLKKTILRICPNEYDGMFRSMTDGSYSAYIGSTNSEAIGKVRRYVEGSKERNNEPDVMYARIKAIFKGSESDPDVSRILAKISDNAFLKKQLTSENGVIPNQVYVHEMKTILKNAEEYLPFLIETDERGYTVSEKILMLFRFKIPYYVGPVGKSGGENNHGWAVRKNGDKIYPWNFYEVIDEDKTAQAFINNLLGKCTYLPQYTVLPKKSLLYEKFMVLNELNNLKINGSPISVELKQAIYNDLFMKGKRVTLKALKSYLVARGVLGKTNTQSISGIDGDFKAYLSSVGKFNDIFHGGFFDRKHIQKVERIIYLGTIYGDDKKRYRKVLETEFGQDTEIKGFIPRISGFKFSEWGRISREFLENLEGADRTDGVIRSIIQTLWETNDNLMQILSSSYTFSEKIDELNGIRNRTLSEWKPEDLEDMYLSAPVKRMVWQSVRILDEIEKIMGGKPKRVFVEMTRSDEVKGDIGRKSSRKREFLTLYKGIKAEGHDWIKELEDTPEQKFRIKKLYLYYCQMGRSMYTGKPIDMNDLFNDNLFDIDHIYPQHFVKDDSLRDNCVLVEKQLNNHKQDVYPLEADIQSRCIGFWKSLRDHKLITDEKYRRLTRTTAFTVDERAEFVERQIVETSQATKVITQILKESLPETSDVVFSKAGLVSSFRHSFDIYKSRSLNDFHHAQDAYLNIVVGNAYFVKFTRNPRIFIGNAEMHKGEDWAKYNVGKFFAYNIVGKYETAWINEKGGKSNTIDVVKRNVFRTTPIITRRSYKTSGPITKKDTIISARIAKPDSYFPTKTGDTRLRNVERYGGRRDIRTVCYCLISYTVSGKEKRCLEAVPSYLALHGTVDEAGLKEFMYERAVQDNKKKEIENFVLLKSCIPFNSYMKIDGYYYYLAGKTNNSIIIHNAVPLKGSQKEAAYIKKIDKALDSNSFGEVDDKKKPVITSEKNVAIYEWLCEKFISGIFKNKKGALVDTVIKGREKFVSLSIEKQSYIIRQILLGFIANTNPVDLSEIGGSKKAGVAVINKNICTLSECILISQSVTGLYETREDLLRI